MPLPHSSVDLQLAAQPSPPTTLPSSQISPMSVSVTPLPQSANLQVALQKTPEVGSTLPGGSQSSFLGSLPGNGLSTLPLSQRSSDLQSAEQPSPSMLLPSSHFSPSSTWKSPQVCSSLMHLSCAAAQ